MKPTELDHACNALLKAKESEAMARDLRIKIEQTIVRLLDLPEEGTKTEKTAWYKVSGTAKLNRTLITERLSELQSSVPTKLFDRVISYKPTLNIRALKQIATSEPNSYLTFSRAISTKPAKPSVKVELLETEPESSA